MPVLKIKNNGVWEQVSGIPDHTHVIDDITDFPTSLPANGGNADTVDGKHASDFASAAEMTTVQNDINDINTMLNGIEIPTTLPNPNALRFTGAVNTSYNGSSEVSVEIPDAYGATETVIFSLDSVTFVDNEDGKMEASIDMPMPFTEAGIYKVKIGNRSGIAGILQKDIDDWNDNYNKYGEYIDIDLWDIFRDEKNLNESFPDGFYYNNTTLTLYDDSIEAGEYPVSITKVDAYPSIKMDKVNPTAIGSFSLNRKPGSTIGAYSHAEGQSTTASGSYSHTEGAYTTASASCSHAEGSNTTASGPAAHAEGYITIASGRNSHAEGQVTTAKSENQHVQGKHNIEDSSGVYADIIGNGIASKRSNAATVDWSGNAWYAGDVYVGSTSGTNKDEGSKKLATEEYVNNSAASIEIPTTLPNPNALTFTGAVNASYNGSSEVNVNIPSALADLTTDSAHRLVTDTEKSTWNAKAEVLAIPTKVSQLTNDSDFATNSDVTTGISTHNSSTEAHNDIRLLVQELTNKLNTLADSDDTTLDQLSEIVSYIKNNKSLIDSITTSKVSVTDIIDNLTTSVTNKPLSAKQGVALKALIDAIVVPTKLPNPNAITFTGAAEGTYDGSSALTVDIPSAPDIPTTLPNPRSLTFTGAVNASYDGSSEVSVEIPVGADGKSAYQYAKEGGYTGTETEFSKKLASGAMVVTITDNNGTLSADKTYIEIWDAIIAGIPVLVDYDIYCLPLIGVLADALYFGTIVCDNGDDVNSAAVGGATIEITQNDEVNDISATVEIPKTLPNPNALTFTGAATGTYDGSKPVSIEIPSAVTDDHINSLIDTKLGVIENGSY